MKKYLLYTIFLILPLLYTLSVSAQNLGITIAGTTNYPQTTIGNTLTEAGSNAGNYLIFNPVTTTVPLNTISIRTYGSVSGTISVTIYNDNGSDSPGTKLFTEVAATVTANTLSTITIPNTYLPAGKYWLAYNMNSGSASANFITKSTGVTGYTRKSLVLTYGTSFPNNPTVSNLATGNQDHISFTGVAIQGYAKASKAVLGTNGIFSSMSFYSHAAGNARLAIYNDASGTPSAKQWESGNISVSASAWTSVNISTGTPSSLFLSAGTYWLVWQWNNASNGPSYTAGSAGDGNFMLQTTYGSFPTNWSGGTSSSEKWSIYATYIACTPPAAPSVTGANICTGNTATLTASGAISGDKYLWYDAASNGNLLKTSTNYLDNSFLTPVLTITTNYWVSILRSTGCESNRTQVTAAVSNPVSSVNGQANVSCNGGADGSVTIHASGGISPYSYSVDNGLNWISSVTDPYVYAGLNATTVYKIRVKDNIGCTSPQILP